MSEFQQVMVTIGLILGFGVVFRLCDREWNGRWVIGYWVVMIGWVMLMTGAWSGLVIMPVLFGPMAVLVSIGTWVYNRRATRK